MLGSLQVTKFEQVRNDPYFHQVLGARLLEGSIFTPAELATVLVCSEIGRVGGLIYLLHSDSVNHLFAKVTLQKDTVLPEGMVKDAITRGRLVPTDPLNHPDMPTYEITIGLTGANEVAGWLFSAYRGRKALARYFQKLSAKDERAYRNICKQLGADAVYYVDQQWSNLTKLSDIRKVIKRTEEELWEALCLRICC